MPPTRPLKVFLCHASADKPAVRKLYRYLKERKMDPWLDAENLLPGQNWQVEIPKALLSSDVIIICLSNRSVDKEGYVQKEIKFALDKALEMPEGRIFLIPARLEECNLPHSLSTYHYVDLFEEDGYRRLLKSLRLRAEQIGAAKVSTQAESISLPDIQKDTLVEIGGDASSTDYVTEKNVREAVEKAEREKTELEAREKLAREDVEREKAEKLALEILERETKEKAGRGDAAEKSAHEKVDREAKQDLTHGKTGSAVGKKKSTGKLKYFAFAVLGLFFIVGIFYFAAFVISQIARSSASPVTEFVTTTGEDSTTLVYIPEGEFIMGSNVGESNESPVHKVYLDAFWISHTEITNQQYAICVEAGVCEPPSSMSSSTRPDYYGNPDFDYYPVIYVSWDKANRYCEVWAKGDLPTEAQWEKAARGTDALIYPWGNDAPNDGLLNYNSILEDTTLAFNVGVNGVYDMAGNVWEWVNDWYDEAYYQSSPYSNPVGPDTGKFRVLRGGSWSSNDESVRSSFRYWYVPAITSSSLGFRCVRNNSQ